MKPVLQAAGNDAAFAAAQKRASDEVVALARYAGSRGWVPASSGNFSARINGDFATVTRSGGDKGALSEAGVMTAKIVEALPDGASAETPLHLMLYRLDPAIGAVAHIHHHAGTILSRRHARAGQLRLEGWELQKAFAGVTTHEGAIDIPIIANDQDTARLAESARAALSGLKDTYGFLVEGHGLYAWGRDANETRRHLDAFDALFALILDSEARQ